MRIKLKENNGITLIALVITVVVMLILAGVAISVVTDDGGVFDKTRNAALAYEESAQNEADEIQKWMNEIDIYLNGLPVDNNPIVKDEAVLGTIVDENQTFDGRLKGTYDNPIIPKGFAPKNENGADWGTENGYKKGLIIQDENENEFVWVPVDGITIKFERYNFGKFDGEYSNYLETLPTVISDSVRNNEGFYIARYEAGNLGTEVVSKNGVNPYVNINWYDSKIKAEEMYTNENDNYGAVSTLIYGTQWDTTLKFIGAYDVGEVGYNIYATNSTGMGNYKGTSGGDDIASISEPTLCGTRNAFRQKNIYDMAGNIWEWTMEAYGSNNRVNRGGNYGSLGLNTPASYRHGSHDEYNNPEGLGPNKRFSCSTLYKIKIYSIFLINNSTMYYNRLIYK